ncbi:transcriptional regulator, TetR family [Actinacidiphila rubida]|uniref:Transcriptional regulator, TetR family n=2 Tax=Actinacidiphila rubida TaxID=310780 RepID=A0A1H8V3Z2_9ACTN|nr:TetR family transcriptional regulator [Actinacidiphila rubida]SEP09947.1 transcriptional regulator, TetR family [Actinacidiphila rubida]
MSESTAERRPRPRNAQATKALLLRAATAEFAEHGMAGARIDRIAERAGANKRLLYVYFGDKSALFDAVVRDQITAVMEAVPLPGGDLCAFAAARYDYVLANPEAGRIAAWRTFEQAGPTAEELESFQERVDAVARAQREGRLRDDIPAADLFAIVLRVTESWLSAPPALREVSGDGPSASAEAAAERLREHRAAMLAAVRSLAEPRS